MRLWENGWKEYEAFDIVRDETMNYQSRKHFTSTKTA